MFKKLYPFIGKYKKATILTVIVVVCEVLLEILIPRLMSNIIDIGIENSDIAYIVKTGLMMVGFALLSLCCGAASGRCAAVASIGCGKNIRKALFDKIQNFSFKNIDKYSTSSLVMRLTTDITNCQMSYMVIIRFLVRAPIMLICATLMTVSINARLSMIFLVAIPILGGAMFFISRLAYPRYQTMLQKYDSMNASVQENLIAIRVVKAFVRSKHENDRFRVSADELRQFELKAEKTLIYIMPVMQFVMYGCMVAVSWFGGNMIIVGDMLPGEFMSFISYISQILISLMMITMSFVMLVLSRASISRIVEVLEEQIDITDENADAELTVRDGSVSFKNVSFAYNAGSKKMILSDINIDIHPGETIGIIGGTGSAKTTFVQLIPRLYDVLSGSVEVGGHDVREYKIETLRNAVAMVLQKNVLFSGTIKDNLRWGDQNATDAEIIAAAQAAQAHDFIMSFPDGYDTDLGQGGVNVSGGQKQRLCIARALLKKPKVIILDDSTSAVDTATDSLIRDAFRRELRDTTTIIIAQRINSVQDADRIIVMDEGAIVAIGNHEQLLAENQIYREVYQSQQKGVE